MNWKVVLGIITCNVVLMSASYTMLIPFLPVYLSKELHASPETLNLWTGAIFAVSFAVCAIMAPIWGKLSDKKGKKIMLLRSSFLIAVTYALGGIVTTPLELLFVRVLQGFAAGLWPASLALMSAYSPKSKIGICMGVMQSANICGGILGPLLGGVLADTFGMRATFFIASSTLALITLITLICIKEPPKQEVLDNKPVNPPSYRALLSNDSVKLLLLSCGLTQMVILLLQPIMTLYIAELRGSEENILFISGIVFSLSGVAGAIAAPIWGRQGQAKGFFVTEVISLMAAGIIIASQCLPSTLIPFAILQFCAGLGFSGIFPSANAMIINQTAPNERGSAFGLLFSAQQVGGAVGPLIGGLIATFVNLSSIFFLSGLILVIMSVLFYKLAPHSLRQKATPTLSTDTDKPMTHSEEYLEKLKNQVLEEMQNKKGNKDSQAKDS